MTSTLRKIIVLSALDHHSTMCVQDFSNKRKKRNKKKKKKKTRKGAFCCFVSNILLAKARAYMQVCVQ